MVNLYLGLDLSLTSTGIAITGDTPPWRIRPKSTGVRRLIEIRDAIVLNVEAYRPALVAVEGYAYGRPNGMAALGELGGVVRVALHESGARWCEVTPATVKKFATGKGNATKEAVLAAAIRRLGYTGTSTDEADALWLAHIAAEADGNPAVDMPAVNRAAIAGVSP